MSAQASWKSCARRWAAKAMTKYATSPAAAAVPSPGTARPASSPAAAEPRRIPNGTVSDTALAVLDALTFGSADHPVLVIDLHEKPEPSFRSEPRGIQAIENNLSIANVDFAEFATAVDDDGIHRGF